MLARRKKTLGIDIGTTAIKVVVLEPGPKGYLLQGIKIIDLPAEKNEALIITIIKELLTEFKVREFALSLPGRFALIRSVAIPSIAASRIDATLKIEVQHRIPFPLDQVVWSSFRLPVEDSNTIDFVVGAVKKDIVKRVVAPFTKFKEEIAFLDADPLVLTRLLSTLPDFDRNKTYALLEIGAESSNLIIIQKNLILVRSLTIAGNTFTESIREEKGIDFATAEKEKLSLTELPREGNINYVVENLITEIQSSVDYWRFTHKGPELDYFFLTGGAASLSGLTSVIENRLRVPTRILDPFVNITIPENVNVDSVMKNRLAIAVGMALRANPEASKLFALDFLPPEYIHLKETRRNQIFVYLSSLLAIVLSLTPGYFFYQEARVKQMVIEKLNADLQEFEQHLPAIQDLEREINDLKSRYQSLNSTLSQRYLWLTRLIDIGRILPSSKIYLTRFTPSGQTLVLDGESTADNLGVAFRDVRQFVLNLNTLPYLQNASVVSLERDQSGRLVFQITVGVK